MITSVLVFEIVYRKFITCYLLLHYKGKGNIHVLYSTLENKEKFNICRKLSPLSDLYIIFKNCMALKQKAIVFSIKTWKLFAPRGCMLTSSL